MSIKSWVRDNSDHSLLFLFCTFITRFCTLLCCCFTISCFMEDVNARQQFSIFFFFLNLDTVLKNQLQKIPQHLTSWMKKNESYEVWGRANSIFKWRFLFVVFSCFESRLMMISPSFHLSLTDSKGRRKGREMNKIWNFVWIYCYSIGHSFTAERCEFNEVHLLELLAV